VKTSQLIVLWYTGLSVVAILVFQAISESSANYAIAAVVVLAGLLIYTLRPHPEARKRWVLVGVAGPILLVSFGFYGLLKYWEYAKRIAETLIPLDKVELVNTRLG